MRKPDIEALLFHHQNGDPQATLNLMALFCEATQAPGQEIMKAMAAIIRLTGPTVRIEQHKRNVKLKQNIELEAKDRGSREKAYVAVTGDSALGVDRLRQIDRNDVINPLSEFVLAAQRRESISTEQMAAAQDCIASIRRQLLSDGGKSREKRALLGLIRWSELGATHISEEIDNDVKVLIASGTKPVKAYATVGEWSGNLAPNVKKIHQRHKAERSEALASVAQTLKAIDSDRIGVHPSWLDLENRERLNLVELDAKRDKTAP